MKGLMVYQKWLSLNGCIWEAIKSRKLVRGDLKILEMSEGCF